MGSNLGDRQAYLQAGLEAIAALKGIRVAAVSSVYETAPVGYTDQPFFLNAVVARSFDMRGYDFKRVDNFDAQCVSDAADALERSLGIAAAVPVGNAV